jgi:predicted ribosome quality control (RQC) complex YloA/Tae2 family protein
MRDSYFTLKILCDYFNKRFQNSEIYEIFTQERSKLVIALKKDNELYFLEYSAEKNSHYLVYREKFGKAKKNVAGLLGEVYGKIIENFSLKNNDRIISIKFTDGTEIIFSFIPSVMNCFYLENEIVINAYKDKEKYSGKSFGEIFPGRNITPDVNTVSDLLKSKFKNYGKETGNEILLNLDIKESEGLNDDLALKIENEYGKVNRLLDNPKFILYENENEIILSLLELKKYKNYRKEFFENINSLLLEYTGRKTRKVKTRSIKDIKIKEKQKEIDRTNKKISGLKKQLENCENAHELKKKGDLIYSNFHSIKKGDREFKAVGETGNEITVNLKTELSPAENAEMYYKKYKNQKGSVDTLKKKIALLAKESEKLENELRIIEETEDRKGILKMEKMNKKDEKPDETSKFRKFVLSEKYEVWVGKDSASNDLLTTKFAAPNDLWFHVRGASGSHTVLKVHNRKENVDKSIIGKAASIAAYYSKARNASNVPVAYCEKKYVRKLKGMKTGSVIMEREKVIFAKPGLPGD